CDPRLGRSPQESRTRPLRTHRTAGGRGRSSGSAVARAGKPWRIDARMAGWRHDPSRGLVGRECPWRPLHSMSSEARAEFGPVTVFFGEKTGKYPDGNQVIVTGGDMRV